MNTQKSKVKPVTKKKPEQQVPSIANIQKSMKKEVKAPLKEKPSTQTIENEQKHFYLGCVIGVKYVIDVSDPKRPTPTRKTRTLLVWSDRDLANEPDEFNRRMEIAQDKLLNSGYYLKEEDALAGVTFTVGGQLSQLAHDLEYDEDGVCCECTRKKIMQFESVLKLARDGYYRHNHLRTSIKFAEKVGVFPNDEDMDLYEVRSDGKFYLKNPPKDYTEHTKISFGVIKPEDLPKEVRDGIEQFIASRQNKVPPVHK